MAKARAPFERAPRNRETEVHLMGWFVARLLPLIVLWVGAALVALSSCAPRERTFDSERAYQHLLRQVEMGPRVPGTPGHARTLEVLLNHLEATADRVSTHRFREVSALDSSHVEYVSAIGVFNERAKKRILFGAHWDTRPFADRDPDPKKRNEPVPGANDGGSGVAVLLELASALRARPPQIGVDLVFFDAEDSGIEHRPETYARGSRRFVAENPGYRPSFAVILDMVGRRGTKIPKEGNSFALAGPLVESVWAIGRRSGITALLDSVGPAVMDDHIPFLSVGIPAIDLIDLSDPAWHTTGDLPENCSPEALAEMGELVLAIIRAAEEEDVR
jgi:hypothetical protein